jgi:large subunit ribosomal protein L1
MPSPKGGTVTTDLAGAINEYKAGKLEFRADRTGIVHVKFGKSSFSAEDLLTNLKALQETIDRNRPSGAKGRFWRSIYISSSMGPSIEVDINGLRARKVFLEDKDDKTQIFGSVPKKAGAICLMSCRG